MNCVPPEATPPRQFLQLFSNLSRGSSAWTADNWRLQTLTVVAPRLETLATTKALPIPRPTNQGREGFNLRVGLHSKD